MLLAFKLLSHNPFLWKERKINSIIAMIVLLVIASLVVRYLPLYHTTLPHPELNIPCWADLLLPYIRLSSVLPYFPRDLNILVMHFFLLFHVWVNIEIKGCCDVGMTEQYAYCLVVAVAFKAACRKVVGRCMSLIRWNKSWMPHQKMCRTDFTQWVRILKRRLSPIASSQLQRMFFFSLEAWLYLLSSPFGAT